MAVAAAAMLLQLAAVKLLLQPAVARLLLLVAVTLAAAVIVIMDIIAVMAFSAIALIAVAALQLASQFVLLFASRYVLLSVLRAAAKWMRAAVVIAVITACSIIAVITAPAPALRHATLAVRSLQAAVAACKLSTLAGSEAFLTGEASLSNQKANGGLFEKRPPFCFGEALNPLRRKPAAEGPQWLAAVWKLSLRL